jgi:hypothetical protein
MSVHGTVAYQLYAVLEHCSLSRYGYHSSNVAELIGPLPLSQCRLAGLSFGSILWREVSSWKHTIFGTDYA